MTTKKVKALSPRAAQVKGALLVFLRPMIAQDAKINLNTILADITDKNFASKKAELCAGVMRALDGKLAKDADPSELPTQVPELMDALGELPEPDMDPNSGAPMHEEHEGHDAEENDQHSKAREFLNGKLSAEDMKAYDDLMAPAKKPGEDDDEAGENEEMADRIKDASKKKAEDGEEDKDKVSKGAMDAAIAAAVKEAAKNAEASVLARTRATREAERDVQPYIGTLAIAQDSADAVYKLALDHMGVDLKDVPTSAYRALLKALPVPGSKKDNFIAQDAAAVSGFSARFPQAVRIGNVG